MKNSEITQAIRKTEFETKRTTFTPEQVMQRLRQNLEKIGWRDAD